MSLAINPVLSFFFDLNGLVDNVAYGKDCHSAKEEPDTRPVIEMAQTLEDNQGIILLYVTKCGTCLRIGRCKDTKGEN
jgi:hypothetical protein